MTSCFLMPSSHKTLIPQVVTFLMHPCHQIIGKTAAVRHAAQCLSVQVFHVQESIALLKKQTLISNLRSSSEHKQVPVSHFITCLSSCPVARTITSSKEIQSPLTKQMKAIGKVGHQVWVLREGELFFFFHPQPTHSKFGQGHKWGRCTYQAVGQPGSWLMRRCDVWVRRE